MLQVFFMRQLSPYDHLFQSPSHFLSRLRKTWSSRHHKLVFWDAVVQLTSRIFPRDYFDGSPAKPMSHPLFAQHQKPCRRLVCFFGCFWKIREKRPAAWHFGGTYRTIPRLRNLFCTFAQVHCVTCRGHEAVRFSSKCLLQSLRFSLHFCIFTVEPFMLTHETQGARTRYFCLCSSNPRFTFNLTRPTFPELNSASKIGRHLHKRGVMRGY